MSQERGRRTIAREESSARMADSESVGSKRSALGAELS